MSSGKNCQGRRSIMRSLAIHLVCWFSWFSCFAFAQFDISEGVTGSVNFPALGITCVANLAVYATSLIRGGLNLEIGARDMLDHVIRPKLKSINGIEDRRGLTTCRGEQLDSTAVVFLSNGAPTWYMEQFMRSDALFVDCIILQFLVLKEIENVELCQGHCQCIEFWTKEEITMMLARRMPGTLKLLPNNRCLLPCLTCLINGCHGCNQEDLLRVEGPLPLDQCDDGYRLRESGSTVVSEILDIFRENGSTEYLDKIIFRENGSTARERICICIPMKDARRDEWTKLLLRSLRSKDEEGRGVRVTASEALEGYLAGGRGGEEGIVEYNFFSFIGPRLIEVIINLVLTFWFRVDGFSSALVARRTVRDYLLDSKGRGFAASQFLSGAMAKSDPNNTQICQVLFFRGHFPFIVRIISFCTACANLVASLGWVVLICFESEGKGGVNTSPTPSKAILLVIIIALFTAVWIKMGGVALFTAVWIKMGGVSVGNNMLSVGSVGSVPKLLIKNWRTNDSKIGLILYFTALALEAVCIVGIVVVANTLGIKVFGRWVYAALQLLVWLTWVSGCYFLSDQSLKENFANDPYDYRISIYSTAFLLNAVLAGVRCKWEPWPWKGNHLFSRKMGPLN